MPVRSFFPFCCCLAFLLLLNACAVPGSRYYPVTDLAPRKSTLGFSVTPPPGKAWFEKHQEDSLYYLKKTRLREYSIYTKATEIHLNRGFERMKDFHAYVKNRKDLRQPPASYRNIEFKYADVNELSPYCVRYSSKFEDHGENEANPKAFFRVKKTGIICMHPESPQDGIDMYYLERSLSSFAESSFQKEGETFLASLKFLPVVN